MMLHLSVCASAILCAAVPLVHISVAPSAAERWSAAFFGDDAELRLTGETFDIRVDWDGGASAELLAVPLTYDDTLVIDGSGELYVTDSTDAGPLWPLRSVELCGATF